jgi:hypothetical protein
VKTLDITKEHMRSFLLSTLMVGAFACAEEKDLEQWSKEYSKPILDSIGKLSLGCYAEPAGFFILEFDGSQKKFARKLTYRKGFPLYIDTLLYIKHNEFRSKRLNMTYLIKDTCVLTIHYVKIIHPSSNWQGQTPWAQPYVTSYKRLDLQ